MINELLQHTLAASHQLVTLDDATTVSYTHLTLPTTERV